MRLLLIAVVALAIAAPAWSATPAPGLVAAYAFDEGAGATAVDATGGGNNGAIAGATWTTGRYGGALSFDGSNDWVSLPALGTFYNTAFTLEAWVQKATTKNDVGIVGTWAGGGPMLWVDHIASRYHLTLAAGMPAYLDSGHNPSMGQWQHLAATFDGSTARFYIDGIEVSSRAASGPVGLSNVWRIGAYGTGPGGFFDGMIDEVRVYNRALGAAEIQADRDQPLALSDLGAPTAPGNITVSGSTQTSVAVGWSDSTDDTGVVGYTVYVDGDPAGTTTATAFTLTGLSCSNGYVVEVAAVDGAGNTSPRARVDATTAACDTSPGLVAAYGFDEGSGGTVLDASGNGRTGSITGGSWVAGRHGGGLSLNGSGDYVSLGSLGLFYNAGFTLEAWVRKSSAKKDVGIVGTWAGNGPMLWVDHVVGHNYLTLGGTLSSYVDSGQSPAVSVWQHLAATFDGGTARYYLDGLEVGSQSYTGSVGSSNVWRIGAYGGSPGNFFDGVVDDIRIYDRALTGGRIRFDRAQGVVAATLQPDTSPPTAPGALVASAGPAQATLSWGAATDDTGVIRYNVHRSMVAGFAPTAANRVAQPTGTGYTDTGLAAGVYYYRVTAEDAVGNVGPASNETSAAVSDASPPSAPGTLAASGGLGQASLTWGAATDNIGVTRYNVHRSTASGFAPSPSNRIGESIGPNYVDSGLAAGTYYYRVTAEDSSGNVGPASNQASAAVTVDPTPPTVAITAPAPDASAAGITTVTANAMDNVGVVGVQFRVDGVNLGAEDLTAPYAVAWDTRAELNGSHSLTAVARDASGNTRTSTGVSVTVVNAGVSTAGLKVAYAFDETSGTLAYDSSGEGLTAATIGSTWTTGRYGGAVDLDGTSDRIDLPGLGTFYGSGFTYEAWLRKDSGKKDVAVLGTWTSGQSGGPMIWIDYSSGRYMLTLGNNLSDYLDSGRLPTVGQWEHVAATYDGTTARFYINGAQVAIKVFSGAPGSSNTWRIGAYNTAPTGFFDGLVDNVRVYSRALTGDEIQTDMVSRVQQETIPPTVTASTPEAGATGLNVGTSATARFSEPMQESTIASSTFQLRDPDGVVVAATVSYNPTTGVANLTPQSALAYGSTYTATVKGGTGGVTDIAGNALAANVAWSFTTEASPPQLLVVTSTAKPFGSYLDEILRNEGLNLFTTIDVSFLSPALLSGFDVVLLGETSLSAAQVSALTGWVNGGGNLIAMKPDHQLAGLLGVTSAGGTRSDAYLKVDTSVPPGAGIVGETIQYHGTADRYTLNGAAAVAMQYSNATTATTDPAVTLRSVGSNGGQAAAFMFDLARSVVYTRQGNPAWAGQERDGVVGIRPDDMFYGAKPGDVQPDWLNTAKIAIPQADEQQRLLANMITLMNADQKPLPRFWYLPRGERAVVVMSGDDHGPGGTAFHFDRFKQLSPPGCVVAEWQCVRASSYIYTDNTILTNSQAGAYAAEGFEVGVHPSYLSCPPVPITEAELMAVFDAQVAGFKSKYSSISAPVTNRIHCVFWPSWASSAKVELAHGMRMDGNYYHYPSSWIGAKPGFLNGGGFPMRFADLDGTTIDVYQANTNMTDEAGQAYPETADALLDNAIGPHGFYGAFGANMHTDLPSLHPGAEAIVASAQARGVPVISYKQLLDWTDGRNNSTIRGLSWNAGALAFTTTVAAGANGLQTMLPLHGPSGTLSAITRGGSPVPYTIETIKGVQYALFLAATATFEATYS